MSPPLPVDTTHHIFLRPWNVRSHAQARIFYKRARRQPLQGDALPFHYSSRHRGKTTAPRAPSEARAYNHSTLAEEASQPDRRAQTTRAMYPLCSEISPVTVSLLCTPSRDTSPDLPRGTWGRNATHRPPRTAIGPRQVSSVMTLKSLAHGATAGGASL